MHSSPTLPSLSSISKKQQHGKILLEGFKVVKTIRGKECNFLKNLVQVQ